MAEEETPTPEKGATAEDEAPDPALPDVAEGEASFQWKGLRLDEMGGVQVGRVEGSFVDDVTGRVEWLMARMGRFGHYCLVPARDAVTANGRAWVPYTRDQIRRAPRVQPGKPLERESEQMMLDHYGIGKAATGRSAELAEREAGTKTVHPADS